MIQLHAGRPPPASSSYDADILILSLGRAAETEAAIRSALAQSGLSRHVIVLDQGSDAATLARFAGLIAGRQDAMLAFSPENLGVAGGRNAAAALGHGAALIALDNDAVFATEGTAAAAAALLRAEPELAAIGFRILDGRGAAEDLASWGYPLALLPRAGERFEAATFVGAGHAIRRSAWAALGGYDAALHFTWEEFDFALRAIAAGWRLLYAGDIAVHHGLAAAERVAWQGQRWRLYLRNRLYIARKWRTPWPALALRIAAYAVKSLRIGLPAQGAAGICQGLRMPLPAPARPLPAAARSYLYRTDGQWRGHLWQRLRREIWSGLPGAARRPPMDG
ncbi:glycosyltransferase family 2 protein [Acidisoma sp. C75]